MKSQLRVHTLLSERHVVSTIVYLYQFGPRTRSEIYAGISTNPRMSKKLKMMADYGLVVEKPIYGAKRNVIGLTPLGEEIAKTLCEMEKTLGGNITEYRYEMTETLFL